MPETAAPSPSPQDANSAQSGNTSSQLNADSQSAAIAAGAAARHGRGKKVVAQLLSLLIFVGAIVLAVYLLTDGERYPRTDDAYAQARYITVSAEVPGRLVELAVRDGQAVTPGELLLRIDPASYQLAVDESLAQIAALEAQIAEAERQRKASLELVKVARDSTASSIAREELAKSTYERMTPLAEQGYVTKERYDSVSTSYEEARSAVLMAKSNELAAELSVPSLDTLRAELKAAQVRLAQAELELQRTQVKAPFAGYIVNCNIAPGMLVSPGQPLFTLVDSEAWFVVANYREGDLKNIRPGDAARVRLLTLPDAVYTGRVVSIGHGVQTNDGYSFGELPTVRSQLNWIRTAQRFPVRILIESPEPQSAFRIGASAVVVIEKQ